VSRGPRVGTPTVLDGHLEANDSAADEHEADPVDTEETVPKRGALRVRLGKLSPALIEALCSMVGERAKDLLLWNCVVNFPYRWNT
jgi:hypothetical protein